MANTANDQEVEVPNINWTSNWQTAEHFVVWDFNTISIVLGCFILISATVLGTISNALALKYFLTKNNIFFNALKIVAVSDMVICQLSTFYAISLVAGRAPVFFSHVVFCWAWNVSWKLITRFSLHLVAIQSMIRTIKILSPFQILSKSVLTVVIVIDLLLMSIILCVNRTMSEPIYTETYANCVEQRETHNMDLEPLRWSILFYATFPYPLILVCCVLCTGALIKQNLKIKGSSGRPRQLAKRRSHSVISILAFSITGLLLNIPPLMALSVRKQWYKGINSASETYLIWLMLCGQLILRNISVTLNSVLNPLIFYWRMADFRSYVEFNVVRPIVSVVQELVRREGSEGDVLVDGGDGFPVANDARPAKMSVLNHCSALNITDTVPTRGVCLRNSELEPNLNDTVIVHRNAVNFDRVGLYDGQSEDRIECQSDNEIVALDTITRRRFSSRKSELESDLNDTVIVHRNAVNFDRVGLFDGESEDRLDCQSDYKISALETEADEIGKMKGNSVACSISKKRYTI